MHERFPVRLNRYFFLILFFSMLVGVFFMAVRANSDMADGRFSLFMDERITFDGVKKIIHPNGFMQFLGAVLNGGDQRYGRILWNSMAIFSVIPEFFWGAEGQIIASRMLQFFLISISCCVVAFGLLQSWFLRFVLLVVVLSMPFSTYYMTMPKPEPLQLFFLSLFLYFFVKKAAGFSWYWVFAGLAFGTKISTLPALVVFALISFVVNVQGRSFDTYSKSLGGAFVMFFLGLAIAVPILFLPLVLCFCGVLLFGRVTRLFSLGAVFKCAVASVGVGIVFFVSRPFLKIWVASTFLNTKHGADRDSIGVLSWINYFFSDWLLIPVMVGYFLAASCLGYFLFCSVRAPRTDYVNGDKKILAIMIAMAGFALNVAIAMGAKRLWGFYLYPGMVLMTFGMMLLIDVNISASIGFKEKCWIRSERFLGYLVSLILLIVAGVSWAPKAIDGLNELSLRTSAKKYALQYSSYQAYMEFLNNYSASKGKRLRVMFAPSLFPPESNEKFEIVEFWGPYVGWDQAPDVIVLDKVNTPGGSSTERDSPNYNSFLIEREGYAAHVVDEVASCKITPCFVRELKLLNGGEVLVLRNFD